MKFIKGGKAAVFGEQPALKPYDIDFLSYEAVIVGTPVWASTFAPPLRSFFAHEQITNQKTGFFACEKGSGGEKCLQKLKELTGADRIDAQMILIDPKQNPDPANDEVIRKFCEDMLHA